jgi:hypothetical protein
LFKDNLSARRPAMRQHTQGRVAHQVRRSRRKLTEDLCLQNLLPAQQVQEAIGAHNVHFRDCLYTPLVTLWTFLYQVLSADQCCRAAVARLLAFVSLDPHHSPSAKTDPYCKARQRLPEQLIVDLMRDTAQKLQQEAPTTTLLQGRPIKIVDGTTASMPDTPANQKVYPQSPSQKPGLGYPILRLVGLISLSCGAVLDVAMGPYSGKQSGEPALFRQLLGSLRAGDVLLGDGIFANYWTILLLAQRGVDAVMAHDGKRRLDFRSGRRLGPTDHVVSWKKPPRPPWMSRRLYDRQPATLSMRELRVQIRQPGFRVRQVLLVTTLLDGELYSKEELAAAYRLRWHAELDLRSIKQVMQMDVLRCKTPEMVRKELWMHLLAYNLVRRLMAAAAAAAKLQPRQISFKGTLQTLTAFAAAGFFCPGEAQARLYQTILAAVATHRVGDRPNRVEPRAVKRRPKKLTYLTKPRALVKARLLKRS